jgi:dipeptide/tripeptide permease
MRIGSLAGGTQDGGGGGGWQERGPWPRADGHDACERRRRRWLGDLRAGHAIVRASAVPGPAGLATVRRHPSRPRPAEAASVPIRPAMNPTSPAAGSMFSGHPVGLYRLFFIEMWERLGFYTIVAVLMLYAKDTERGGLGLPADFASEIYGIYLAFVYFTPYLGGLLADRYLGYRKSVLIGGLVFATGFLLLGTGQSWTFPVGLILLCIGNGFFKPNISAMVGNLYAKGDPKRDAGFNIFYMGINVGAFTANFLAAYTRNEWWWEAAFIAAGCGLLLSCVILLASWKVLERADRTPGTNPEDTPFAEILKRILGPAFAFGLGGWALAAYALPESITKIVKATDIGFLIGSIPILMFFAGLSRKASEEEKPGLRALLPLYLAGGTFFMVLHLNGSAMTTWAADSTARHFGEPDPIVMVAKTFPVFAESAQPGYYGNAAADVPRPNRGSLLPIATDLQTKMFGQKRMDEANLAELKAKLPVGVVVESVPTSGTLSDEQKAWKDFCFDVYPKVTVTETTDSHGLPVTSVKAESGAKAVDRVAFVRTIDGSGRVPTILMTKEKFDALYVGNPPELAPGVYLRAANAELYQSWNAFFVVVMTPLVMLFFARLLRRGVDFSTARKILAGMAITGIAAVFMAIAGVLSDNGAAKVSGMWILGFYAIVTVGELCLSPMALSLVTKLSPKRFVGLTMGGWFFATAVGNKFSGFLGVLQGHMTPWAFWLVPAGAAFAVSGVVLYVLPKLDAAIKKYGA